MQNDKHDINSYIADNGGIVISTLTRAKALADSAKNVVTNLDSSDLDAELANLFGERNTTQQQRDNVATQLDRIAQVATRLAADLRAPQIDQRI